MIEKIRSFESLGDKLKSIFWGPSWEPGTPRLGEEALKIDVSNTLQMYMLAPVPHNDRQRLINFTCWNL